MPSMADFFLLVKESVLFTMRATCVRQGTTRAAKNKRKMRRELSMKLCNWSGAVCLYASSPRIASHFLFVLTHRKSKHTRQRIGQHRRSLDGHEALCIIARQSTCRQTHEKKTLWKSPFLPTPCPTWFALVKMETAATSEHKTQPKACRLKEKVEKIS